MKLGLQLGYWGAQPPDGVDELVAEAERSGFDAVFTAEAWGSDAFTPLAWWGRETSRVRLGTSIVQMSGRSPTSIAMHALTLDHLTGGRVVLGMGVSGPQVVEGWHGVAYDAPLQRTREIVDICRQVWRRERLVHEGPKYTVPRRCRSRVNITLGYSSVSVTAMYGNDLSSRSRLLNGGRWRLTRFCSRWSASASVRVTITSTSSTRSVSCAVPTRESPRWK